LLFLHTMNNMDAKLARRTIRKAQADEMLAAIQSAISVVLPSHPIVAAYVYGSVIRGTPLPQSDIDIAVLLSEQLTGYTRLQLELAIQADLEDVCTLASIDVRALNDAPLLVQGRIIQEGVLIYEKDRAARVAYEVMTRKKYFDYLPLARRVEAAAWKRLKEKVGAND
jgi:uncharacterized protein